VLDEPVPELRIAAVTLLGRADDGAAVPAVVECLDDEDHRVRERAARACGRLADPRAVEPLLERIGDDVGPVRREVATALGLIGGSAAASGLSKMSEDPAPGVRQAAVTALGEAGDPSTVQAVTGRLDDDDERVRRVAVYALLSLMTNVPADRSHEVREEVLTELREAPGSVVVTALVEILDEAQEPTRRRNAAWLLGRVAPGDGTAALNALVDALDDEDEMTAKMAATSLTELGADRTEQRLVRVVEDGERSSGARANAAFALGRVGGDPARRALDDLVDNTKDKQLRKRAFTALSRLGGR
jgi:FOG: HEAT repeat